MAMTDMLDPATEPAGEAMPAPPMHPLQKAQMMAQGGNLADMLEDAELGKIASNCIADYDIDKRSMTDWEKQMQEGIKLAQLVEKPDRALANVRYPLITTAALQFNAKAYPAIVAADQVVKCTVQGRDPDGRKAARADRVATHMSYDLTCKVPEWEEDTDKMLAVLPIVGTCFRKWWWDAAKGRKRCRMVVPGRLVMNHLTPSMEDAPRLTEELPLFPKEVEERKRSGEWRDVDYLMVVGEDAQAIQLFLEQHCLLDLDGDGLEEPYIVTLHKTSMVVARIVADYSPEDIHADDSGKILSIRRGTYFTAFKFMPSMDGGFYGTGLGLLLGDLSETVNTILNQLIDASNYATKGGGFIGLDARFRGGKQQMMPGEWRQVLGASGDDIRKALVPLAYPEASPVLFQLLGMLIDASKDVSSVKDVMTGDTTSSTMPVGTTLALIEQGMAQFTAAYKRIFRALREEFKLVARINAATVDPQEYNRFLDAVDPQTGQPMMFDPKADYDLSDMDIEPVADPASVTRMQQMGKAQFIGEGIKEGFIRPDTGAKRMLEAANIPDVDELIMQPDPQQQQLAQLVAQLQAALLKSQGDEHEAHADLFRAQAQAIGMDPQTAQLEAQSKQAAATANIAKAQATHAQAQASMMETQAVAPGLQAENMLKVAQVHHVAAQTDHTVAQTDKVHADIQDNHAKTVAEVHAKAVAGAVAVKGAETAAKVAAKPAPKPKGK